MMAKFGYESPMAVPKIEKVVINTGFGKLVVGKTSDEQKKIQEAILNELALITGQKPILTRAKKSISAFKIRKGIPLGSQVILRRKKMFDFLERLIHIGLPRSRDFRGINLQSFDRKGNLTIGIREHIVFPEVSPEKVKNIFGFVAGARKAYLHSVFHSEEEFAGLLVDLYERITPQLNIIDGVIGLEGNGPGTGGTPKKTGLILASKNAVALDIVASRTIGYDPMSVMTNKIAVERKLVEDNITVVGDNIKVEYQKPKSVRQLLPGFLVKRLSKHHVFYPHILPAKCTKCGICAGVCPQKAIANFVVNRKKCIACYCCQEFCPDHAIDLKMDWLGGTIIKGVMLKRKLSRLFKKPEAQNN